MNTALLDALERLAARKGLEDPRVIIARAETRKAKLKPYWWTKD